MEHSYQTMAETAAAGPSIRLCPEIEGAEGMNSGTRGATTATDPVAHHGDRCGAVVSACQRWARRHSPHAHPVLWMGINGICCLTSFLLLLELLVYDTGPIEQMEWGLPLYACWSFGVCAIWCVESAIELLSWSSSSLSSWQHGGGRVSSSNDPSPQQLSHNEKTDHHQQQQQRGKYLCELFGHIILLLVAIYFTISSFILLRTLQTVALDDMKANTWDVIISFVFYLLAVAYNAATWWCGWSSQNEKEDGRGEENDDNANKGAASYQSSYQLV
jgi:hypothetical protein